jgi:hypothetical protein
MKAHKATNRKPKAKVIPAVKLHERITTKKPELNKFEK